MLPTCSFSIQRERETVWDKKETIGFPIISRPSWPFRNFFSLVSSLTKVIMVRLSGWKPLGPLQFGYTHWLLSGGKIHSMHGTIVLLFTTSGVLIELGKHYEFSVIVIKLCWWLCITLNKYHPVRLFIWVWPSHCRCMIFVRVVVRLLHDRSTFRHAMSGIY